MATRQEDAPSLAELDARLARIETRIDRLVQLLDAVPAGLAVATNAADELAALAGQSGLAMEERVQRITRLLVQLSDGPALDALEQLVEMLQLLPSAPHLVAMLGDGFDEVVVRARDHGLEVERTIDHIKKSGALTSNTIEAAATVAAALGDAAATREPDARIGMWGVLKATRDPDVQRALAFLMDVAKRLGTSLENRNKNVLPLIEE